uniref:Uncharacterized protein n=1 Tax=Micrurus corallinus TaxID=54390 RepID=A0A2D4EPQ2_MICCO
MNSMYDYFVEQMKQQNVFVLFHILAFHSFRILQSIIDFQFFPYLSVCMPCPLSAFSPQQQWWYATGSAWFKKKGLRQSAERRGAKASYDHLRGGEKASEDQLRGGKKASS